MPLESIIIGTSDGRIIVSRLKDRPSIVVELHRELADGNYRIAFTEVGLNEAGEFGEALMRLATAK